MEDLATFPTLVATPRGVVVRVERAVRCWEDPAVGKVLQGADLFANGRHRGWKALGKGANRRRGDREEEDRLRRVTMLFRGTDRPVPIRRRLRTGSMHPIASVRGSTTPRTSPDSHKGGGSDPRQLRRPLTRFDSALAPTIPCDAAFRDSQALSMPIGRSIAAAALPFKASTKLTPTATTTMGWKRVRNCKTDRPTASVPMSHRTHSTPLTPLRTCRRFRQHPPFHPTTKSIRKDLHTIPLVASLHQGACRRSQVTNISRHRITATRRRHGDRSILVPGTLHPTPATGSEGGCCIGTAVLPPLEGHGCLRTRLWTGATSVR